MVIFVSVGWVSGKIFLILSRFLWLAPLGGSGSGER